MFGTLRPLLAASAIFAGLAAAAPASAQIFFYPPEPVTTPVTGAEPGLFVPPMPDAQPPDQRANLIWNLRSALNVAALNCQYWGYLNAVDNYNNLLRHHAGELATAYDELKAYFRRTQGSDWQSAMDVYTTSMYQSYIRIGSQRSFCHVASETINAALAAPKGQLYAIAQNRMRGLRMSLVSYSDATLPYNASVDLPPIPRLDDACWHNESFDVRRC